MLNKNVQIIAEVKTESPFGFKSKQSWEELFRVASKIGDIISVHTDPHWGGSFDLVKKARRLTDKQILAKGIHKTDADIRKALKAGADWVLVVGRVPKTNLEQCMIEPVTLKELSKLPKGVKAVWNSRDLKTGGLKVETFKEARKLWGGWLCQASNIKDVKDVEPSADAILVGEHLLQFANSLRKR